MIKEKPCKGQDKAKGYGCGNIVNVKYRKYGLCPSCLKKYNNENPKKPITYKCEGKELAEGFTSCGKVTEHVDKNTGLCKFKCYPNWLVNTDAGKLVYREVIKPKADKVTKTRKKEETKKLREGSRKANYYPDKLQTEINLICRLIDKGTGCISCNGHSTPAGGHYHSRGANPSLRFHLDNIHLQDFNCNNMRGANIPKYDIGLIERYGKPYWERIKFDLVRLYPLLKLHQNDYPELIAKSREIAKELKSADQVYTPTERLELRLKYNEKLGIYKT